MSFYFLSSSKLGCYNAAAEVKLHLSFTSCCFLELFHTLATKVFSCGFCFFSIHSFGYDGRYPAASIRFLCLCNVVQLEAYVYGLFTFHRPCILNIISSVLKSIGHIFTKLSALVLCGTRMNASSFGIKRSKFKVTVGPVSWKLHFLALLT